RTKNEAAKDYPNIITYRNSESLLADKNIELVVINTPNYTHFEFAKQALYAGKHVLIEKPFSVTSAQAQELFNLGTEKNLKVLAYQNRRFDSDFIAVKKVLGSGKLGKITEAHLRFDRFRNTISPKKFKEEPMPGSGIFYDLGAHLIDQAIALFGIPASFSKTYGKFREHSEVDDFATAHLKYDGGLNVFVTTNMLVLKPQPAYTVYGTNGTFTKVRADEQEAQLVAGVGLDDISYGSEKLGSEGCLTYLNGNETISEIISSEGGNYMELFDAVFATIRNDQPYFVKSEEILAQLEILEQKSVLL
ncbi:MAG: Gfo/Idh/MocA family oxidoreductase, partial [Methylotenera sp.]|nr:Gfo/Idh/MocA family oxidoreductase [Flavobacterium sp.]